MDEPNFDLDCHSFFSEGERHLRIALLRQGQLIRRKIILANNDDDIRELGAVFAGYTQKTAEDMTAALNRFIATALDEAGGPVAGPRFMDSAAFDRAEFKLEWLIQGV